MRTEIISLVAKILGMPVCINGVWRGRQISPKTDPSS